MTRDWQTRRSSWEVGLATLLSVTSAFAVDGNIYNGSECTFTEPGHYDGQERSNIKLWNQSGQTETVSCPLKRDIANQPILEVYIIASAEVDEDSCVLWAREDDFSYSAWRHDRVESTAPDYNKTTFAYGTATIVPADWSSLQLTCSLPDDSGILSYYLYED
ncbi:MAG TPA: hypothetical protein VHO25_19125 [Polyangiaceae bacterium]|nr:hypothetical protein [Polyangiaceae bacterium]